MHEGKNIALSNHPKTLIEEYKKLGMTSYAIDMSEFQKSGGGVKCLTLEIS
jgi:N-dimethylarginine dimethylaminohydrolase